MSKPINCNKFSSRRTDQTAENNSQEMAAYLLSRKRRSKGHEQELREELLQPPRIGIENYPSRKAFGTHLSDSHSPTFSDLINGFSRKYAALSHARFKEKGRDKRKKNAAFTVARLKFLLNFQTQKAAQEKIIVESFLLSAQLQVRQPSLLHDTVHAVTSVIHENAYDKIQREESKRKLDSLTSVAAAHESQVFYTDLVAKR